MTSVSAKREFPLVTLVNRSAKIVKTPVLDSLISSCGLDFSGQSSWIHSDSDSSQIIDSITTQQTAATLTGSFLNFLATVLYRYTYQSEFELQYAQGVDQKQSDISKAIQFVRIQFRNPTLANIEELGVNINNVFSSINAKYLLSGPSFKSAYCLIELKQENDADLNKLTLAFEHYQGIIWLIIERRDSGYQLKWLCNGSVSVEFIEMLQTHMLNLIDSVHQQPTVPLSKHTMLSEQEIQQQLGFSKGKVIEDQPLPLFKLIENHALTRGDEIAIKCEQTQLSYQQLNQQANYLAHALLANDITPRSCVAVHINPSENILVAILAIHKIGAIYVPIDPTFPAARISAILNEVKPLAILCDSLSNDISEQFSAICADITELKNLAVADTNPEIAVTTENISHIYFTSGTTGKPKGVMATHKNLIHYISAAINGYSFNQEDSFIAAAKFTFSISMFELVTPLVAGGCVNILPREQVLNLKQLCQAVVASTVFHFGPSLLKQLLPFIEANYPSFESFDKLRHVSSGGDMVPPEILEKLKKIFRNAEVYVIYGSSEISCMGCTFEVSRDHMITKTRVGSPHQNMTVRIFDNDGNRVPVGVAGQLYFAGGGLVQGYLNLPELTEEKFQIIDGQRFYAIGDVGRLDDDGNIELLGREDFQIQLRGIRIELAEIDGYLRKIPELKDAVASAQYLGDSDEKSIIAYVVSKTDEPLSVNEMKKHLIQYMPDYMIPAAFVQLDALPLNHNMKLDRKALPAPSKRNLLSNQAKHIGSTDTINQLVKIINQVCSTGVTSDDAVLDFYALGIESIALMQIRLLINKQFDKELPLTILQQEHTNIAALANHLDSDNSSSEYAVDAQIEKLQIVPRDQSIIASFAQQRLWFLDRLLGTSGLYNIPWAIRLKGTLNVSALQQSFAAIVARHEILRTAFSEKNGEPWLIIQDKIAFQCDLVDLSTIAQDSQNSESQNILDAQANKAFELDTAPLIRAVLVKMSEREHILSVTMHHIVSDGWSMGVFKQELASLYRASIHNQSASLPQLPIQYADFAVWQRQWLKNEFVEKQLDYWRIQLAGLMALELPTDHPRPKQLTYRGALETLQLSKPLSQRLKALSQQHGVSLFMTLLTAFQVLMHRYSGQDNIVVGSPIAGRNKQGVEPLIGFFINTLVLRNDLSGNPVFSELLQCVRKTCIDAYAHQDVPFEELVAKLQPERDLSRHPLFQVMLILQPALGPEIELPDLEISEVSTAFDAAKFDLTLSLQEHPDGLKGFIEYSTDLFDAVTITRFVGHFQTLLKAIVAQPETPIVELPLLTDLEHHQLLVEWNDTETKFSTEQTMVDLFEQQVRNTPDIIAAVFESQQLSYQQLNSKVNQLAHYLVSLKDQAGTILLANNPLIAIAVDRSLEMVIGILAILKAGGAYVPIDPGYPSSRVHHMLSDSAAPLLLTQSHLKTDLALDILAHNCVVLCLDELEVNDQSVENLKINREAEELAYVIFTSGSTGKPKGVMIENHNLSNFLQDMRQRIGISTNDKLLAVTTLSFDIHVLELHLPLISGSTVIVATRATASDGLVLQQQLAKHDINYMQATPITWELLKHSDWQPSASLNILCGGEAMTPELANYLSANGSNVWNVYGPTETTIWSSAYQIQKALSSSPSIGQPIANTRIYILNKQHQLQPYNIPGELCIAGQGLARGYLNRAELTAEKFIDVEFFGKIERIYKTGDLARWHTDGNLECLGRIDHQIKLRGFRIELGEIESILGQYPGVNNAIVIAREDSPGDKRLVAYLTNLNDDQFIVNDLRLFLKEKLPDYMIPSAFVLLDQLPQTPSGKVDRKVLPAPDKTTLESEQTYVAPRSPFEERLAFIWQEILKIDRVSIHDNFFELGGHSLLVVTLLVQIEKAFGKNFSLVTVFQAPTIAQFVELLASDVDENYSDSPVHLGKLVPSESNQDKLPLFCIYGVFLYQDLANHLVNDVSVYGVFIQEEVDLIKAQAIEDSLSLDVSEIAKRYIKQIRSVQKNGPYNLAGASFGGIVAFEIAQQLIAEGERVNILALYDAMAPTGFKWSLPRFLVHHSRQIMIKGIPYLLERLHRKIAKNPHNNVNDSDVPLNKDIRVMVRKTAISSFSPSLYPGKISLFRVKNEKQWAGYKVDPYYGWREFAEGGVDLVEISSSHLGLLQEPHVQDIADYLRKHL